MKTTTKLLTFCVVLALTALSATEAIAQKQRGNNQARPSPNAAVSQTIGTTVVDVTYGRPSLRGRDVNTLINDRANGPVWRTGANEATVFKLSAAAKINGELLKEGSYALFTIPGKDKWTIIFNSVPDQWGAYSYDSSKDVLKVDVKPSYGNPSVEMFTIDVDNKGKVILKWDDAVVSFKVS